MAKLEHELAVVSIKSHIDRRNISNRVEERYSHGRRVTIHIGSVMYSDSEGVEYTMIVHDPLGNDVVKTMYSLLDLLEAINKHTEEHDIRLVEMTLNGKSVM